MKRRSFLAGGAAAVASSVVERLAQSQSIHGSTARRPWNLLGPSSRYVIRLSGSAVIGDCYRPASDVGGDTRGQPPTEPAMILHGSERQPVSWRLAVWHQPNPLALMIALSAVEVPLEA